MNSILHNAAAMSALQALSMTQQALSTTQNQVSTGLAVATAADNASYWSISQQLQANSGIASAANTALAQSQAAFDTANTAIKSVITTINSIQQALTQATNSGANYTTINTTLKSLASQLTDAVKGASFNGLNLLDGSQTGPLNIVSGYNSASGAVTNVSFSAQALTGGTTAGTPVTTQLGTVTDAATVASLNTMIAQFGGLAGGNNGISLAAAGTTPTSANVQYGNNGIVVSPGTAGATAGQADTAPTQITITSMDQAGNVTVSTYTAVDADGLGLASTGAGTAGAAGGTAGKASAFVETQTYTSATGNLLTQNGTDLTTLGSGGGQIQTAAGAGTALSAVTAALGAVTNYAALIGATQDRMSAAADLNSALTANYASGISALVDADMNTASTRLQALQTQQQLGIQSLSIANQNAQLILKLFP